MTIFDPDEESENARPVAVLDFEASALQFGYPIEVGVAFPDAGTCWSWLIAPTEDWRRHWRWDPASAAIHGISLDDCVAHGLPPADVCARLDEILAGHSVLSDSVSMDGLWAGALYSAIGRQPSNRLEPYWEFVALLTGDDAAMLTLLGHKPDGGPLERAIAAADRRFPTRHRAGDDAARLAEVLRVLGGLASNDSVSDDTDGDVS